MLQAIKNNLMINTNLATGGQPTAGQFSILQAAGYEMVINLVPSSSPEALPGEEKIVTGLGMTYLHIPVIWDAPTRQNLEQFFEAMHQHQHHKVFVHCVLNYRVSVFVFLYHVMIHGIKMEKARQAMLKIWEPNPTWERFIQEQLRQESQLSQNPDAVPHRRPDV